MQNSSEYTFPIFISSTDYNLKDLRAELAKFLSELGYRPILSSADGFPDSSPALEPWESCLPVLDRCFVMILVIDGKYGTALPWPHFKEYFEDKKMSPTHGEYVFSHKNSRRMFVFIRKSLMPIYETYKNALKNCNGDRDATKSLLSKMLPEYVDYETLEFIGQVKTTKPIPWINEFEDITVIKQEVQKKLLNELAEYFLVKNKHFDTVIESLNKVMESLSPDEKKNALQKIHATKEIIDAVDQMEQFKNDLERAKIDLAKAEKDNSSDKEKFERTIKELNNKIRDLEKQSQRDRSSAFIFDDGKLKYSNSRFLDSSGTSVNNPDHFYGTGSLYNPLLAFRTCDECDKLDTLSGSSISSLSNGLLFKQCTTCNRFLCNDCWNKSYSTKVLSTAISGLNAPFSSGNESECARCRSGKNKTS